MSYSHYYQDAALFHGSAGGRMGTQLDVLLAGADEALSAEVWQAVLVEIERIGLLLDRFKPGSETTLLNTTAAWYPVSVSDELWQVLLRCRVFYEATGGLFDVTLHHFDRLLLNADEHSVSFLSETMQLDFGGFGKGYALQQIETLLRDKGITRALVNFGNSAILAVGTHPHGDYWPVSIANPFTGAPLAAFRLKDEALSVSGNQPAQLRHIIHPQTGAFADEKRLTAVVSRDAVEAEVLTTAMMLMNEDQLNEIDKRFNVTEKQLYRL